MKVNASAGSKTECGNNRTIIGVPCGNLNKDFSRCSVHTTTWKPVALANAEIVSEFP
jgi:hypothetical protein